jgi:hypothetical protein
MDILLGLAALVVLISVPALLGLIYLELRQRRMFGPRSIISADHGPGVNSSHELASIAMSLQSELERMRSDVHGAISAVSTDVERVREHLVNLPAVRTPQAEPIRVSSEPKIDPQRASAVADLYAALSKLDVTFLAVSRPVLLPGESFDEDTELPLEAYAWDSWNDVGAAAYQFAEVFSERRLYLDPETRDQLNTCLGAIRRSLTQQLYPALTDMDPRRPDENRESVLGVVSSLAARIQEARGVLERSASSRSEG